MLIELEKRGGAVPGCRRISWPVSGTDKYPMDRNGKPMNAAQSTISISPPPRAPHQLDAVSASLRQAYSATVAEDVPDALLDLLNKLQ